MDNWGCVFSIPLTRYLIHAFLLPLLAMSRYVLVASSADLAGSTMSTYLSSEEGFDSSGRSARYKDVILHVTDESLLTLENIGEVYPDACAFIFLSKHRSDSGIPTLTCHCTGNFSDAVFGGNHHEIATAWPSLQKSYLKAITDANITGYDVIIEATHHGPTSLAKPVLFIELGSSEKQWADAKAAKAMCQCILSVLKDVPPCSKVGIGLGGTHYPTKFNKLLLETEFGLGAVASKHTLGAINEQMLDQMMRKSCEKVTHIILDAKGLGSHKDRIMKMAENTGLEIVKV